MNVQSSRRRWSVLVGVVKQLQFDSGVVALSREIDLHDGFPSRGESVGGRSGSSSSPVELAAGQVLPLSRDAETVDRTLQNIEVEIRRLQSVLDRYAPSSFEKLLCTVASYNDEWAAPRSGESFPCSEVVEHYPSGTPRAEYLCMKHRKRKDRADRAERVA